MVALVPQRPEVGGLSGANNRCPVSRFVNLENAVELNRR
jgi:hypothetical protein